MIIPFKSNKKQYPIYILQRKEKALYKRKIQIKRISKIKGFFWDKIKKKNKNKIIKKF